MSERGIEVDRAKIKIIEKQTPSPYTHTHAHTIIREVRSSLGHARFYRRFIKDLSKITNPLTRLLMKYVKFNFDNECIEAFSALKMI